MPSLGHKYKVSALQSGKMAQSQQALASEADTDSELHKMGGWGGVAPWITNKCLLPLSEFLLG